MKTWRKVCLSMAVFIAIFILGGVSHEADIQRMCKTTGQGGEAAWLGNFSCHPLPQRKDHE